MRKALTLAGIAAILTLSACGDTLLEQGAIGAAAGAGTAAAVDGDIATGAVVGAGVNVAYCQNYPERC